MLEWSREAGPCNCSRRYLPESTQRVMEFKRKEKEVEERSKRTGKRE